MYLRPQGDLRLVFAHQCVTQHLFEKQPDVFVSILDILVPLQVFVFTPFFCEPSSKISMLMCYSEVTRSSFQSLGVESDCMLSLYK